MGPDTEQAARSALLAAMRVVGGVVGTGATGTAAAVEGETTGVES